MSLMLAVLDEVVSSMSINFAGHNVKLELTYLDVIKEGEAPDASALRTDAMLRSALAPVKQPAAAATA